MRVTSSPAVAIAANISVGLRTEHNTAAKAGTRLWEEAEDIKRQLQDQLAGRAQTARPEDNVRAVSEAVDLFIKDKKVKGVTPGVIKKYALELERLSQFCARKSVYTVQGISRELLTDFCATWETYYPSSYTRAKCVSVAVASSDSAMSANGWSASLRCPKSQ